MRLPNLLILLSTLSIAPLSQAAEFKLYAIFTEDTRVELSDGAVWMMDKGDVFPIKAYKNMQKNVILQLAGATFMAETARIRVLKPEEVTAGIEVYRKNVRSYLDATSKKLEDRMRSAAEKTEEAPKPEGTAKPTAETPADPALKLAEPASGTEPKLTDPAPDAKATPEPKKP